MLGLYNVVALRAEALGRDVMTQYDNAPVTARSVFRKECAYQQRGYTHHIVQARTGDDNVHTGGVTLSSQRPRIQDVSRDLAEHLVLRRQVAEVCRGQSFLCYAPA